ncbi:polyphosphate kinase 2 family protein [Bacteroidota bacterium]
MNISDYKIAANSKFTLADRDSLVEIDHLSKKDIKAHLRKNVEIMQDLQAKLYAHDKYAILIVFQAMDTAGKDGAIKHVMTGLNPQGTQVHSFKQPSEEELDHDYLWRAARYMPNRGEIGIFNRSYYEEVLVVRVHNLLKKAKLPTQFITDNIWDNRYRQIRDYEKYLYENGVLIYKFFLHISKEEQKNRLLARIDNKSKNWKFSEADLKERNYWEDYQKCFSDAINMTSTRYAPWYVIPSDNKWISRYIISSVLIHNMKRLGLHFPLVTDEKHKMLLECKKSLLGEK